MRDLLWEAGIPHINQTAYQRRVSCADAIFATQFGSVGTFQGVLNPASSKSVIETCIMPVLLYGCENWILKERPISQLNSFLGELAKRCLRWPKHHSNTAAQVALDVESIRSRLLFTKLGFLRRSMLNDAGVGAEMRVMSDDVESLCQVKECRELEEGFGTSFTDELLSGAESVDLRDVRKEIRKIDREKMLEECAEKSQLIVEVGKEVGCISLMLPVGRSYMNFCYERKYRNNGDFVLC